MAGPAQHLAIADRVVTLLGEDYFKNVAYFFSGNIAPDAIHARANYVRAFKKHTHLTEGIANGDFIIPDKLALFRERLGEYIKTYYNREDEDSDLYLGYIAHLITDEIFNLTSREIIVKRSASDGINQDEIEFFHRSMSDMDRIDYYVAKNYPFVRDVEKELMSVSGLGIRDMILPAEADVSRAWVVNKLFHSDKPGGDQLYYSYEEAFEFIKSASDEVAKRLKRI